MSPLFVVFAAAALAAGAGLAMALARAHFRKIEHSELAREKARIAALIENITDGLVVTNLRGEVLHMNAAAREILLAGEEAPPGKALDFRQKIQDILKNHTLSDLTELRVHKPGGKVSAFYKTKVALFSTPGGEDLGVVLIMRDVTNEKRVDAMKEEFFQAVAHDLRAPLFAMQGYLRLLEKSTRPDSHQKGYFDAINQSCEKLTLFIQDTLDSARIQTGQMKLMVSPVDPQVLLQRAVNLFRPLAEEKGIRLELGVAPDYPPAIDVDERLIERVFYNLLSNALKFTPRGGAITVEMTQAGPNQIEFSVVDTGPGIPPDQLGTIFEKFRQVGAGGARSGFGLGLNICQKIVQLHRGVIWADSEPGMGSQFTLRIPINQSLQEA